MQPSVAVDLLSGLTITPAAAPAVALQPNAMAPPAPPQSGAGGAGLDEDLGSFLTRHGVEKLMATFAENDIDTVRELTLLTEADFKEMNISIGLRNRCDGLEPTVTTVGLVIASPL